jgi:AcrR family transcriptional regulator
MARTSHSADSILDAARRIVVERGARAATLEEIVRESGAPTGSIYYRFGSVDQLLARLWLRAARRSHAIVEEVRSDDPIETVVGGATAIYDLCLREPEDAVLLSSFRPSDFLGADLDTELRDELKEVNASIEVPLAQVAAEIPAPLDVVIFVLSDLPYTFARHQHSFRGKAGPGWRAQLETCVRTVIEASVVANR